MRILSRLKVQLSKHKGPDIIQVKVGDVDVDKGGPVVLVVREGAVATAVGGGIVQRLLLLRLVEHGENGGGQGQEGRRFVVLRVMAVVQDRFNLCGLGLVRFVGTAGLAAGGTFGAL